MNSEVKVFQPNQLSEEQILAWVKNIDALLAQPLSARVDVEAYANKLWRNATMVAIVDEVIVGAVALYCNEGKDSFITLVGILPTYQGRGLSKDLMREAIRHSKLCQSTGVFLECDSTLVSYYESLGFEISDVFESGNATKYHMTYKMMGIKHFPFEDTPVVSLPTLGAELGVNLSMKRDDVFSKAQGGNKARKLQYILFKAQQEGCDAVVTAGDINSNHNRATALMCASLGMRCRLVVHNEHPENEAFSMNSFMSRLSGAELIYCSKKDVAEFMDKAMDDYRAEGYKPFYIWGGGHCLEGSFAYYDAARALIDTSEEDFDYVFFPSGTGTTHAGLHVGFKTFSPGTVVQGISIARTYERGLEEVFKSTIQLQDYLNESISVIDEFNFTDQYVGSMYESIERSVVDTIKHVAQIEGIMLDPTYTGKAFNAMLDMIKQDKQKYAGKNVLFWNTGGIFNLLSHRNEL